MWKCYFLKILLKTRSVNKHESSLVTGMKFPASKHWKYSSISKGVSPFCGSRKCLSQNCCRLLAEMVKRTKATRTCWGWKTFTVVFALVFLICVKNLQTQGRTTKGHRVLFDENMQKKLSFCLTWGGYQFVSLNCHQTSLIERHNSLIWDFDLLCSEALVLESALGSRAKVVGSALLIGKIRVYLTWIPAPFSGGELGQQSSELAC